MPQRLATATDWSDYLKKYNKDVSGISDWEKYFLEPTKQYYQTQAQAVSAQTEYDISGAYQNYLRTQRSLLQNQQLASGFKEQLGEEAKSAYESAYATAKTKEAASLYDVSKAYTEALAKEDERLLGIGEQLASFEEKLYEFANIDSAYATMAYGQEQKDEAGKVIGTGLGHYEMNPETGEYTLSDRGKAFIQDLLYGETRVGSNSFESYLTDQEETELLDFYRQNQDLINEVFGLEAGQRAPDAELSKSVVDKNYEDSIVSLSEDERFKTNWTKIPTEQRETVAAKVKALPKNYVGSVTKKQGQTEYDVYGEKYKIKTRSGDFGTKPLDVIRFTGNSYDLAGNLNRMNNSAIPQGLKNKTISVGDIITYNGKTYMIWDVNDANGRADFVELIKE